MNGESTSAYFRAVLLKTPLTHQSTSFQKKCAVLKDEKAKPQIIKLPLG